jgi:outer membrane protein assembly factor BamB
LAAKSQIPTQWNDKEKENIAWKVPLVGRGPSSPIIVGDRVYLTSSTGARQEKLVVTAIETKNGAEAWRRQFWATGRTLTHMASANAAPTPTSDGKRIFAFYSSNDLACLDLDGNLLWYRGLAYDYPKAGNDVGMSSSPVVSGKTVVVQIENFGDSFAAGLDIETGETRWQLSRKATSNWCSPTIFKRKDGKEFVLLQSPNILTAHDPDTGSQVWQYEAECAVIPSAVTNGSRIFLPTQGLTALDIGDETAPRFVWSSNQLNASASSPIVDGDRVYTINRAGVLAAANIDTGKVIWQARIGGSHWATPVIANGHMYCINQEGKVRVVKIGEEKGEIVAETEFGENIQGTPAVEGNAMYVRSDKHLWKIANPQ